MKEGWQLFLYTIQTTNIMQQVFCMLSHWSFKCHFCKKCYDDPIKIGLHFRNEHDYNLISDNDLI